MKIQVQTATIENIAPFGKLIVSEIKDTPTFFADHFSYWKQQGILLTEEDIEIGVLEIKTIESCFDQMEMHDKTFEVLVPLNGDFIIPLALTKSQKLSASDVSAFCIRHGDVLMLNPGCWHWMPCAISPVLKMLIIYKNDTSANDLLIESLDDKCFLVFS